MIPTKGRVLLKLDKTTQTDSGFYVPEANAAGILKGEITEKGEETTVQKGDQYYFRDTSATNIKDDLYVVFEEDLLAKVC